MTYVVRRHVRLGAIAATMLLEPKQCCDAQKAVALRESSVPPLEIGGHRSTVLAGREAQAVGPNTQMWVL